MLPDDRLQYLLNDNAIVKIGKEDVVNQDFFAVLKPLTHDLQLLLNFDRHFLQEEIEEVIKNKVKVTVYSGDKQQLEKEVLQINRLVQVKGVAPE